MKPLTIRKLMALVFQVALLLAFLIVALPSILPPARRCTAGHKSHCASNLRQVGLGVSGYLNSHQMFPPGTISNPNLPLDRRLGWGWTFLPHIDMVDYLPGKGISQEDAAALAWDDPIFGDLAGLSTITRCPGSPNRAAFIAIAGLGVDAPTLPTNHKRAGIFGDNRQTRPADIKDGQSTTMMLVESDSTPGPWFAGGRATVRGLDPSRQPYIGPGRQFGGNHKDNPRAWSPKEGANVLFADGSVKFVVDSIDPKVFEALSTMAGGEVLSAPEDD